MRTLISLVPYGLAKGEVMTPEKKLEIITLRNSGLSATSIATKLGIGVSGVKKIISSVSLEETICLNCGKVIPKGRRKPKKFCSDKCRYSYYNSHQELRHKKATITLICPCCHNVFTSYGKPKRKYCSRACASKSRFI